MDLNRINPNQPSQLYGVTAATHHQQPPISIALRTLCEQLQGQAGPLIPLVNSIYCQSTDTPRLQANRAIYQAITGLIKAFKTDGDNYDSVLNKIEHCRGEERELARSIISSVLSLNINNRTVNEITLRLLKHDPQNLSYISVNGPVTLPGNPIAQTAPAQQPDIQMPDQRTWDDPMIGAMYLQWRGEGSRP